MLKSSSRFSCDDLSQSLALDGYLHGVNCQYWEAGAHRPTAKDGAQLRGPGVCARRDNARRSPDSTLG